MIHKSLSKRLKALFYCLVICVYASTAIAEDKLHIIGTDSPTLGWSWPYTLTSFDLPNKANKSGYIPNIPAEFPNVMNGMYERDQEVKIFWDFGDGSSKFNSKDRINASHIYKKAGTYNIKVVITDENDQVFASTSKTVTVKPTEPHSFFGVVPVNEDEPTRLKFDSATFLKEPTDDQMLTYEWDFGDGNKKKGENLDSLIYTYATTGTYKTKLKVTNKFGLTHTSKKTVRVIAKKPAKVEQTQDELKAPDIISNKVNLKVSGSISAKISATAERTASSVFMAPVRNGTCQVWINYWDDTNLVGGLLLVNLGYLPKNGANYKFKGKQRFSLAAYPDIKTYLYAKTNLHPLSSSAGFNKPLHSFGEIAELSMNSGTIDLTVKNGNYILGKINSKLTGYIGPFPIENRKKISINVKGDLSVTLGDRGIVDTIFSPITCKEKGLEIIKRHPKSGQKHLVMPRPIIRNNFNDNLQIDSVNDQTFQVGYPNANGDFIKAPGKIILNKKKIEFVPNKRLRPGIRYTVRVKTGENGVRSASGSLLIDEQGTGWQESSFWTKIDFSSDSGNPSNLSCDVYQSVKNAPLIEGKPALMKIYADWPVYDDVHKDAQYKDFKAKVSLYKKGKAIKTILHKYTRTDRRSGWGKPRLRNEEAAELPYLPNDYKVENISLIVDDKVGGQSSYNTYCSTPKWDLVPTLNVAFFVIDDGRYGPNTKSDIPTQLSKQHVKQLIDQYAHEVKIYAEQILPVKTIDIYPPVFIDPPDINLSLMNWYTKGCKPPTISDITVKIIEAEIGERKKILDVINNLESNAHIIVLLGPPVLLGGGGGTVADLSSKQGLITMSVADDAKAFKRYVNGLVHEFGHVLSLQHKPFVDACSRSKLLAKRDFGTRQWYEGIDAMRISADGKTWWHKSSRIGNDESIHIAPLMFPGTLQPEDAFISHHHYRKAQYFLEKYY
ncbi:hypothetical protein GCM10009133_24940 [Cocleimonas flava]|uniref:PKD domain-containing protein n=1 Tax=Cocleimonas flava TaxID=634765 RepID=A0A4R1EV66_9GAMM|nr:PKD domain-containing protein [Cocleimonas flava]TCJ83028.1 PKD domain-containing protein [Cocleimonas flava]